MQNKKIMRHHVGCDSNTFEASDGVAKESNTID